CTWAVASVLTTAVETVTSTGPANSGEGTLFAISEWAITSASGASAAAFMRAASAAAKAAKAFSISCSRRSVVSSSISGTGSAIQRGPIYSGTESVVALAAAAIEVGMSSGLPAVADVPLACAASDTGSSEASAANTSASLPHFPTSGVSSRLSSTLAAASVVAGLAVSTSGTGASGACCASGAASGCDAGASICATGSVEGCTSASAANVADGISAATCSGTGSAWVIIGAGSSST